MLAVAVAVILVLPAKVVAHAVLWTKELWAFRETTATCNKLYWQRGQKIGVILSLGLTYGCSLISGPAVGQIERCEIWYPDGWEWVRQRELQHCRGYADLF